MKTPSKFPFVTNRQLRFSTIILLLALTVQSLIFLRIVSIQIPGLKAQIADRDKTITKATYILTKQAVPELIYMSGQITKLGGTPPQILLTETKPPFVAP